ncbi:MAG: hypothetical protein IPK55_14920 [Streptococcus sp.]|nr:hypothetical protein [Streptococcus sp.]
MDTLGSIRALLIPMIEDLKKVKEDRNYQIQRQVNSLKYNLKTAKVSIDLAIHDMKLIQEAVNRRNNNEH